MGDDHRPYQCRAVHCCWMPTPLMPTDRQPLGTVTGLITSYYVHHRVLAQADVRPISRYDRPSLCKSSTRFAFLSDGR